jgi:aspartyl/glutamyl-tRNA(Asn/Gln) amidotransferase C subunit
MVEPMTDEITPELFAKLISLASFGFDPKEAEYLRAELNNQLKAIRQLESVTLDLDVPLAPRGITYSPDIQQSLRPDVWEPFANVDKLLDQAPEVEDRYLIVPDIPHTELE